MPRKKTSAGPTPIDAIQHGDKRTNIPTADAQDFVDPDILEWVRQVRQVRHARDESLDPQLVRRGKYHDSGRIVEVPATGRRTEPAPLNNDLVVGAG